LDGALWWPETGDYTSSTTTEIHNDIDLCLVDPKGAVQGESTDDNSIFERAGVAGSIMAGVWKLRIQGCDVPSGTQTVYWAAHARL